MGVRDARAAAAPCHSQPFANPLAGVEAEEEELGGGHGAANPLFSEQQQQQPGQRTTGGRTGFKPAGYKAA